MSLRFGSLALAAAAVLGAVSLCPTDAHACGGCFVGQEETTVVSAHRMALSVSPTQTVLWDQIQYAGSPAEFAWVLPVKPGARLELSSDAWFEALDAATSARVLPPPSFCGFEGEDGHSGFDCGCGSAYESMDDIASQSGAPEPPPVTVVHQETVGPYETVTLHSEDPEALTLWMQSHGYAVPADVQPIIDAYTAEAFDFIALRLVPGNGVQQMQPVRVVSPGASPVLPLRMVAGGTGANVAVTLFVIGEGRWEAENFSNAFISPDQLTWDFKAESSDYASVREAALAQQGGRTWLTGFAKPGALLTPQYSDATMQMVQYSTQTGGSASTIAELYAAQGITNGEVSLDESLLCRSAFGSFADSADLVVNPCGPAPAGEGGGGGGAGGSGGGGAGGGGAGGGGAGGGGNDGETCRDLLYGELDARKLSCGALDDMAAALTGMHPRDVWVTRLEAALPREALGEDLSLAPTDSQQLVDNWMQAGKVENDPCAGSVVAPLGLTMDPGDGGGPATRERTQQMLIVASAAMMLAAIARRARRFSMARTMR